MEYLFDANKPHFKVRLTLTRYRTSCPAIPTIFLVRIKQQIPCGSLYIMLHSVDFTIS